MPKANAEHDKLAFRLTQILVKLNTGEKLELQALANEFNTSLRTVQRDLQERLAFLPMARIDGRYSLDPAYLGKVTLHDVERFACLAGVRDMFPALNTDFLRDIFDSRVQSTLLIKGQSYEDLADKQHLFKQLEQAILAH
jgi:predicted DNA-binding transcriptional regulator YafY